MAGRTRGQRNIAHQMRHSAQKALEQAYNAGGIEALKLCWLDVLKNAITGRKTDAATKADALRYVSMYGDGKVYELLGQVVKAKKAADRKPYIDALMLNPKADALLSKEYREGWTLDG